MIEHDGCNKCKYEFYSAENEPCIDCKGTISISNPRYYTAPDLYEPVSDVIKHPAHYCYSKYEPKDVIRAWGLNFNLGSAVKYIARAGHKDDILQDLKKAKQFLEFEIQVIEEERHD